MNAAEQGTRVPGSGRHLATPRVLIFLTCFNQARGEREVLLLKGAPTKRLWANRYNGLGGHVEAAEDVYTAAVREVREEAGIEVRDLSLRGVVTIDAGADEAGARPGVLLFVFTGATAERLVWTTQEGTPEWLPIAALHDYPLLDDLEELLPRALDGPFFYGHYSPQPDGTLHYEFQSPISS
ncbi:MAG TPA: NUDIX domain-containing protein [Caldilinea sp.]|nr:NUDIX domain-containing protein [Caldilinea sp.]HRA65284.1 NUDIX domain-containing protein [Caldilinea sp.]